MASQTLLTSQTIEVKKKQKALVIDKKGLIGSALVEKLLCDFSIIFLTEQTSLQTHEDTRAKLVVVPFKKRIPKIPNETYSHIFVVQNDLSEVVDLIPELLQKAKYDKADFFFIANLLSCEIPLIRSIEGNLAKAKIILYGELFGKDYLESISNRVTELLLQASTTSKMYLSGSGLSKTYPVAFDDAIKGILDAVFGKHEGSLFFLFQKHPPTELSFARKLQRVYPTVSLDFAKKEEDRLATMPSLRGTYVLPYDYDLTSRLKSLSLSITENAPIKKTKLAIEIKKQKKEKPLRFTLFRYSLLCAFFLLVLPFLVTVIFSFLGAWEIKNAKETVFSGNIRLALQRSLAAGGFFELASMSSGVLSFELSLVGQKERFSSFAKAIQEAKSVTIILSKSLTAANKMRLIFSGKSAFPAKDFSDSISTLKNTIEIIQQKKAAGNDLFGTKAMIFKELDKFENMLRLTVATSDVLPSIFGFDRKKTYMLLFQNNMELRPGGGFIGSFATFAIDKGLVKDFEIKDVYDADGQLTGHIEPPFAIRRYLRSEHWYLRDSNFNVDFSKNASSAAYFLSKELNQKVDGVLAVDVSFVREIVRGLGSVKVSEYAETVTADNFYKLTQVHAEKNFFPGSTQKKDFLQALFRAIQQKLAVEKNIHYLSLIEVIGNAALQKHLLFAFADADVQAVFTVNRLSSSLWDTRENSATLINDFFGINEANLGVNKANYYITRKIKQEMVVKDSGEIAGKATLYYTNASKKDVWPGGDYKNYLRVILPFGATITDISFNGKSKESIPAEIRAHVYEDKKFLEPQELEVTKEEQEGKVIYGFLLSVPMEKSLTVAISYVLLQKVSLKIPSFQYSLQVFKQPGMENDQYSFSFTHPREYRVVKAAGLNNIEKMIKKTENATTLLMPLTQDFFLDLKLAKK